MLEWSLLPFAVLYNTDSVNLKSDRHMLADHPVSKANGSLRLRAHCPRGAGWGAVLNGILGIGIMHRHASAFDTSPSSDPKDKS
jgi:hypothetical protein